jgi:hypothetical protein
VYRIYLETIVEYLRALNHASRAVAASPGDEGLKPYLGEIPVVLEGMLCGFLVDELDGEFMLMESTPDMVAWWEARPTRESRRREAVKQALVDVVDGL